MMQVMVIDMLEGFTRHGPLASPRVDALVPRQAAALRSLPPGSLVVFVSDAHGPDDFELKRFPPHCLSGTKEAEIREELLSAAAHNGARIERVGKTTFSGFYGTNLDEIVRSVPDPRWTVFGCVTDCCVEANIAELVYRGRDVVVVRELVETWDLSYEQARAEGLGASYIHEADVVNDFWFERRLPGIWGVRVLNSWSDALAIARETGRE